MTDEVPIMNEFTHDRLTEALLHAQQGRPSEAKDAIHRALDQLDEDDARWVDDPGARGRVAYGKAYDGPYHRSQSASLGDPDGE